MDIVIFMSMICRNTFRLGSHCLVGVFNLSEATILSIDKYYSTTRGIFNMLVRAVFEVIVQSANLLIPS